MSHVSPYIDGKGSPLGIVNVDWFAISVKFADGWKNRPFSLPSGWGALQMSPTAVWAQRWYIMDNEGNKVATFLADPRSSRIDCRCAMVEIANRWLYYDDFLGISDIVLQSQPVATSGVSRVDLCCDFEMDKSKWGVFKRLATGKAYVKALRSGVVWWKQMDGGRVPHQLSWGGFDSAVHWKVYWKWLELSEGGEESMKPYIVDQWRAQGLSEKQTWRCEVSLTQCNRFRDVDTDRKVAVFDWYNDRARYWQGLYADKFVVRQNQGHKDKRNDTQVKFLDVEGDKVIKYALPSSLREASDPERRLVVKLWYELMQGDTKCNQQLVSYLQRSIKELLERPSNVRAIQQIYGLSMADIDAIINPLGSPSSTSLPPLSIAGVNTVTN